MAQAIPIFIGAGQIGAGLLAADSIRRQGRMESIRHKFNAEMSEISAEDVLRRGEREANSVRRSGRAVRGSQRAAYAAQGVDVDSGSAADIQEETDILSEADSRTVRNNAWREAFGYKTQAADSRMASVYAKYSSKQDARRTILTGFLQGGTSFGGINAYSSKVRTPSSGSKSPGG